MIKKQSAEYKEQSEALMQQRRLAGRAMTLTAGVILLRGGRGAGWEGGGHNGGAEPGRHVPVETCACKCCMRICVNVFSQGVKMAAQNI